MNLQNDNVPSRQGSTGIRGIRIPGAKELCRVESMRLDDQGIPSGRIEIRWQGQTSLVLPSVRILPSIHPDRPQCDRAELRVGIEEGATLMGGRIGGYELRWINQVLADGQFHCASRGGSSFAGDGPG